MCIRDSLWGAPCRDSGKATPHVGRSVARRQNVFAVVPGKLTLGRANRRPAVKMVGLAVLVRSAGPITQNVGAGGVKVHFPLPGRFGESHPMRLVQHRDDATSSPHRLVSGDLLHLY